MPCFYLKSYINFSNLFHISQVNFLKRLQEPNIILDIFELMSKGPFIHSGIESKWQIEIRAIRCPL